MFQVPVVKIMGGVCIFLALAAGGAMLYAYGISKEMDREIADRDNKIRVNEAVIRDLRQKIDLQNSQIDVMIAEGRAQAARMNGERRVVEVKLEASEKEIARLKGVPIPEDPSEMRSVTDPIILDLAKGWRR